MLRRLLRYSLYGSGIALTGAGLITWRAASELVAPMRRPLQDYHREFLAAPAAHGVNVQSFTLGNGTPCLVVTPTQDGKLGARGEKVRDQLEAKGLAVPKSGTVAGNLVLLHGRGGRKEDYLLIAERLCAVGFRCLIPDLPGHGDNPESVVRFAAGEAELPARVLKESAAKFRFEPEPAGLLGMSMGGSVAVHAAALDSQPWKALVIISSFDRLEPVVRAQGSSRGGAWLGGLWVCGADFIYEQRTGRSLASVAPANLAAKLTMPTLVLHGTKDRVIPVEAGKRLYNALPPALEKAWIEVPGADHDNVLVTDFPVYATVAEWMLRHVAPATP